MKDSGDLAGLAVPFAAGVAAGAFLAARLGDIPLFIPFSLSAAIPSFGALILFGPDRRRLGWLQLAALFFLAGIFCSLNSRIGAGIPLPQGPLGRLASANGARLKSLIDSIPYPSEGTAPLVKALLTGDRSGLSREVTGTFRASGASHILALSGLHLGILYLILTRLSTPLGNGPAARKVRYSLTIAAAGFYTLMTGASPSIVRAFLFILIGETARLLGRRRDPVRVLLAALTIQLALKPETISSLGFQLSYLAMTGIVLLYPGLERLYPKAGGLAGRIDPMRRIWKGAVLSISCQAFTAPLVWRRFHTFPKYFIITNLTALPLTSAVMVLSVATIALSALGICPDGLTGLNDMAVRALVGCLEIISSL